ncbi:MAG: hypothetical protein KAV87_68215 [Desulfobacteraceae bacterium]|nr:hypothetical protein [Desulfobacteraceae bacterium]
MERLKALIEGSQWLPFVLSAGMAPKLSTARILESLIIAGMAGGLSIWGTTQVLSVKIENVEKSQVRAEAWYKDTHDEIKELTRTVYSHEHK